jgi:hypothetical protein
MTSLIATPESISKNIFEKYYQIIDFQRSNYESDAELISALDYLERMVLAIERSLQDISSNENISDAGKNKLYSVSTELLNNWLSVVICSDEDSLYINALTYNFFSALSTLENLNEHDIIGAIRHIAKFNPVLDFLKSRPLFTKRIEAIIKSLSGVQDLSLDTTRFISLLFTEYKKNTLVTHVDELNKILLEDNTNKDYFKQIVLSDFASAMAARFVNDTLKIQEHLDLLKNEGVAEIRKYANENDLFEIIERQFEFNEKTHDLIWNITVKITNDQYNAAEIGYLLWTMSKSLESIDDIDVELVEWGEGSKWFHLKVRIKSLSSKVDLADVFKNLRQGLESVYHKKPIDEIQKLEAEKNKLYADASKIAKEEKNLMTQEQAYLKNQLSLHKDLLDIQSKELENESKKAEVRLKNLEYLKGLSSLMKDGIIQNNSDIQILINDLVFFKQENKHIFLGDHELLDLNERTEPKGES